jgi:hypothetical protein
MSDLITRLRGMCMTGTADYTVAGSAYWTDDQLQAYLDRNRTDFYGEQLSSVLQYGTGGTAQYFDYRCRYGDLESGTAVFVVQDSAWSTVGTANYTADYQRGVVTFASNTSGSTYFLSARSYDMNGAAADVWRMKAAQASTAFDWSSDNHSVKRSQLATQATQMANYYEGMKRQPSNDILRGDEVTC